MSYVFDTPQTPAPVPNRITVTTNDGRSYTFEGLTTYNQLLDALRAEGLASFSLTVAGSPIYPEMLGSTLPSGEITARVTLKNAHGGAANTLPQGV